MSSSGWNTIESDAGVFTELVESLGVKSVQLEELLALDPEELRSLSPLYGVIFLFKYTQAAYTVAATARDGEFDADADHTIFFAHQKIQNACATQALLSVLLNSNTIDLGPSLTEFKTFVAEFDPDLRGDTVSNSAVIRQTHNSFSRPTPFVDETQPERHATDDDELYHFIAYVPVNGVLYELDGLQPHAISHGPCSEQSFPNAVVEVIQRRIARYPETELRFNLLAVCRDRREVFQEIGDYESLQREQLKRADWRRENILRRENFVGLIYNILKGVVANVVTKGGEEAFERAIREAKDKTRARYEQAQRRKLLSLT